MKFKMPYLIMPYLIGEVSDTGRNTDCLQLSSKFQRNVFLIEIFISHLNYK